MIKKANVGNKFVILRKRYLSEEKSFGINLSNRAGMTSEIIKEGILEKKYNLNHKCFYTHYRLMIDHDGKVLLCSHDWTKKVSLGDLNKDSIYKVWTSQKTKKYRLELGRGNRSFKPCNNCNVLGTLQGRKHYEAWERYYKEKQFFKVNKINFAFIGCGDIAREHAKVLRSLGHKITLCNSKSKKSLRWKLFNKENKRTEYVEKIQNILNDKNVDFVIVCTSWDKTEQILPKLLSSDKTMLIEKPISFKYEFN